MPFRASVRACAAAAAAAYALACGSERSEPGPAGGQEAEPPTEALASIESLPDLLRRELLRTCDKWLHLDRACDDESVRRQMLECWTTRGERIYAWTGTRGIRPRARYMRTLNEVNLCMEMARWRKLVPGPELKTREE
jgi:hypothetical protein